MALLSTLVKTIADVEGLEETQVAWVARALREAGFIVQKGRGRGSAHMDVTSSSNLLIGLNGAANARDAVEAVMAFRSLQCLHSQARAFKDIFKLGHPFSSALELLIEKAIPDALGMSDLALSLMTQSDTTFSANIKDYYCENQRKLEYLFESSITFYRPLYQVAVDIHETGRISEDDPLPLPNPDLNEDAYERERRSIVSATFGMPRQARYGDRREAISISLKTIMAVGRILAT